MTRPLPELVLERYRLNELPDATHATIAHEAAVDPAVWARLDALDRSDSEIREQYAPDVLAGRRLTRHRSRHALVLGSALALAVLALVVIIPRHISTGDDTRIKGVVGRPALAVYRRTPAGSERLADGDVAHAGDLLRIGYASAGRTYGIILSIDGSDAVTLHLPPSGDRAVHLEPGSMNLLDSSYELDEAPRIERFYFVMGSQPFDVAPVLAAARQARGAPNNLPLPPGLEQVIFTLQKEVRK